MSLEASLAIARREFDVEVDVTVPAGRCLALVGPSGAGKSTVLGCIAGLLHPRRGRIAAGGGVWLDTSSGVDVAPQERRCGYLFQEYALFPHLSAWRNVAYGLAGDGRETKRERALELLRRLGVESVADARPRELSGGERQRVGLARALATEPAVLLLDEPLAALDASTKAEASRELLSVLSASHAPALLVTHDFSEAALLADEVAVIDSGTVVQTGTAAALSAAPASAFVAGFTGASVLTGVARAGDGGLTVVALDGGGTVVSADAAAGPVSVATYPWELSLEPPGARGETSALNHVDASVTTVTVIGNRARVGLATPQELVAEVTAASVDRLGLAAGAPVVVSFKATATRLLARA